MKFGIMGRIPPFLLLTIEIKKLNELILDRDSTKDDIIIQLGNIMRIFPIPDFEKEAEED